MPVLDAILAGLPNEILGDAQWRRDYTRGDNGLETPPGIQNGRAIRIFYREQTGGALNMTFGVFDTVEDANAQYERIKGIREGTENGDDNFPKPHVFGRGLYGSVALFQIDVYYIEVLIERAPGTSANPIESFARRALGFLDAARTATGN